MSFGNNEMHIYYRLPFNFFFFFNFPLVDLVKTRMQLLGESGAAKKYPTSFHALFDIARTEGVMACYSGYEFLL